MFLIVNDFHVQGSTMSTKEKKLVSENAFLWFSLWILPEDTRHAGKIPVCLEHYFRANKPVFSLCRLCRKRLCRTKRNEQWSQWRSRMEQNDVKEEVFLAGMQLVVVFVHGITCWNAEIQSAEEVQPYCWREKWNPFAIYTCARICCFIASSLWNLNVLTWGYCSVHGAHIKDQTLFNLKKKQLFFISQGKRSSNLDK